MAWYNLLVALATLILSLGVKGTFPYCRCTDYDRVSSPFVVVLQNTSSTSSTFTAVFKVVNASRPATPTPCYTKIMSSGSPKIEFDTSFVCTSPGNKPDVNVNGVISQSPITIAPNYDRKAPIRAGFVPNYMRQGATIIITGRGACANWNTLFNSRALGVFKFVVYSTTAGGVCCPSGTVYPPTPPSPRPIQPSQTPIQPTESPLQPGELYTPPPPPVGPPCPYCRCNRSAVNTPYRVHWNNIQTKSDATYNWFILPLSTSPTTTGGPCSNMVLGKIEISFREECKSSVGKTAYIYTKSTGETSARTVSITSHGVGRTLLSIGRLPWDKSNADASTFAIGLLKNSACPTLADILPPGAMLAFQEVNCCPSFPIAL